MIRSFFKLIKKENDSVLIYYILGGFAAATLPYLNLLYTSQIINHVERLTIQRCLQFTCLMLGLKIILGIMIYFCKKNISELKECCKKNIEEKIVKKSFRIKYEELDKQNSLDVLRTAHNSTESVGGIAQQLDEMFTIFSSVFSIIYSMIFVVMLFSRIPSENRNFFTGNCSTAILFGFYMFTSVMNIFLLKKIQVQFNNLIMNNDRTNAIGQYLTDSTLDVKNAKDFRVFSLVNVVSKYWDTTYVDCLKRYLVTAKATGKLYGIIAVIGQFATFLSYFIIGAKAIYGVIGIGDVLLYVSAISISFASMSALIASLSGFRYRYQLFTKYLLFLDIPESDEESYGECSENFEHPCIEFHDVSFRYPNQDKDTVSHINMRIEPNQKVAIVGQNGAGKTTLIKLLCRLYKPTSGFITINSVNIDDIPYDQYIRMLSVVFQDFKLFSYSLLDNITIGKKPEKNINEIMKLVSINDRVLSYKNGLHTKINNDNGKGVNLSGGEAQKIAMVRAIYKNGGIVVLDEPTAALDPVSEEEVYNNMIRMSNDKTTVFVSHRMSSCRFCDNIIVMDKGSIVESGNHDALMRKGKLYKRLFDSQANYYLKEA